MSATLDLRVEDLPSTYDCPASEGGEPVLRTLIRARDKYLRGHTNEVYWNYGDEVCAVGAVFAAASERRPPRGFAPKWVKDAIRHEQFLKDTTIRAIKELEATARQRHPVRSRVPTRWSGQLERLNQGERYAEVLSIYDETIERLRGASG